MPLYSTFFKGMISKLDPSCCGAATVAEAIATHVKSNAPCGPLITLGDMSPMEGLHTPNIEKSGVGGSSSKGKSLCTEWGIPEDALLSTEDPQMSDSSVSASLTLCYERRVRRMNRKVWSRSSTTS